MKVIRRRRTITIETCAFRKWQTEGTEESFSCPNCGKVFDPDSQPLAVERLPAGLIAGILAEGEVIPEPTEENDDTPQTCEGECTDK